MGKYVKLVTIMWLSLIHIYSMSSVMCTQDEVDPRTEKARKELEERLEKKIGRAHV